MHDTIPCVHCREPIGPHWQALQHTDCTPGDGPEARRRAHEQQRQAEINALYEQCQAREAALAEMRARQYGLAPIVWR
jgi:hypothetical protein